MKYNTVGYEHPSVARDQRDTLTNSDYYSWLNPNMCQPGKIGLQWKHVARELHSICSRESELHLNLLISSHPVGFKEKIDYD